MIYEWVKVVHILAIVAWMAGLFYLPRLFVYHADKAVGSDLDETFKVMERRLVSAIMRPAALVSVATGLWLVGLGLATTSDGWLWMKVTAVVGLLVFHGLLEKHKASFARGERIHSSKYFRIINEVPTVLLIVIVIAVVVRPFS